MYYLGRVSREDKETEALLCSYETFKFPLGHAWLFVVCWYDTAVLLHINSVSTETVGVL